VWESHISTSVVLIVHTNVHILRASSILLFDKVISVGGLFGTGGRMVIVKILSKVQVLQSSVLIQILYVDFTVWSKIAFEFKFDQEIEKLASSAQGVPQVKE